MTSSNYNDQGPHEINMDVVKQLILGLIAAAVFLYLLKFLRW